MASEEKCGQEEEMIDIHLAVAHNDEERIKTYVLAGGDLDARDRNNLSPLHIASAGGFSSVVEFLLRNKAGLGVTSRIGHTPLHLACRFGHLSVVLLLLAEGAEINARDTDGNTPLHKAASNGKAQLCRELMKRGADIDARNQTEYTPLHWACFKGHKAAAEQLLKCGANIDAASSRKATSLFMATYYGHVDVTFLLLAWGADVSLTNEDNIKVGETFLPEIPQEQRNQIKVLLRERLALLMKGYEAARRNTAIMYMRSERSELNLRMTQGEVETLWAKLAEREKQLNMSKMGARDLSHVVKAMKDALEQSRRESKIMQGSLTALQTEVDEAKQEAQEQRERAARAERAYAELLEGRRPSAEGGGAARGGNAAREERLRSSPSLRQELQAEEEGGRRREEEGMMTPTRAGGVVQALSEQGVPEWKWQGSGEDGRASPESSASTPPSSLHNVSFGGRDSAFVSISDPRNGNNVDIDNGSGNGNGTTYGGVGWRNDRVPIIASGIVSEPTDTAASPVLMMSDLPPGRVAERAWRINTRIATDNLGPPSITDVVGPLATLATASSMRGCSGGGGWGDGRRAALSRSGSSVSLPPPPRDDAGEGSTRGGRRCTSGTAAGEAGYGGGGHGCASSSKKRPLRRSCSSEVRGTLDRGDARREEGTPRPRPDLRMTAANKAAVPNGRGGGKGRRVGSGEKEESEGGGREGGGAAMRGDGEGGRRRRKESGPATPDVVSAGASAPPSYRRDDVSRDSSGTTSSIAGDKGGYTPKPATAMALSPAAAVEAENNEDACDVSKVPVVRSEKQHFTCQQRQISQEHQQGLTGSEGGEEGSDSINSDETVPASPEKDGAAADASSIPAGAAKSAEESTVVIGDAAVTRFQ